jgi:hypothetical protein
MKNLFVLFALVLTNFAFGQTYFGQITNVVPFALKTDTLVLVGIDSSEVKIEIVEYASQIAVETKTQVINEKVFTDEQNLLLLNKISIAEAIEGQSKIVSKLDKFREKNVQIGGKTPIIERQVTVYVKPNVTILYN